MIRKRAHTCFPHVFMSFNKCHLCNYLEQCQGEQVVVWSRAVGGWVYGHLVAPVHQELLTVEFQYDDQWYRKAERGSYAQKLILVNISL